MSTLFRCLIATTMAVLLILGPFGWAMWFTQSFRTKYARLAREAHIAEGNPGAANLSDEEILRDFGTEVTGSEMNGLIFSDLLFRFWWVWSLFVLATCFGIFLLLGWILPAVPRPPALPDAVQ